MGHAFATRADVLMRKAAVVFWDFDGVIKDSVEVKSQAFLNLFAPYGADVADRVLRHHEANGGVSRYEKMPVYLGWAGEAATGEQVRSFCDRFSRLVYQGVLDAPWVAGVREYLQANHDRQRFILMTATPQEEIQLILKALDLACCFREVHGSPTAKAAVIRDVLRRSGCRPDEALVVGDSATDLEAAETNKVAFILRRTPLNAALRERFSGPMFDGLNYE